MKTYAIGDVHGRADLLEALLSFIDRENQSAPDDYRIVFLGDIIDRGPDSKRAMDLVVVELRRRPASRLILGNHEEFLLLFLDLPAKRNLVFDHWMSNGGLASASSYGLDVSRSYATIAAAHKNLLDLLLRHPNHIAAMRNAASYVVSGDHVLVHAGLRPGIMLKDQTTKDLRTIRGDFLESDYDFPLRVVHGHTETRSGRAEIYNNRIAIDTGAHATGALSALVIENNQPPRFLTTIQSRSSIAVQTAKPEIFVTLEHVQAKVARRLTV
ncbi:metallophosphoesterase [Rhizobium ruizarguesonis]|uniref:metallophosphoesterase n=1 Tax=Rhizobium TaxID=379 RepID=UPI0010326846|nr:metallophosphoesterase [Rhizobium ruizarguesonis]TBA37488.1 serine/threonine protein phosphatase [Rhizobium ruizarguesonis]TBC62835.1 serine/threonine protein phosphatase [Rhizobium ruizarguesonis]TBD37478.1 serine/threonine protein phosphatase [Rhizobium ruizarguesonis]